MKKVLAFLKKKDLYFGIIRYGLAISMMPYGITKLFKTQFVLSQSLMDPTTLEKLSGKTLAWAFLGYSSWFEVLLGVFELIPAFLLLFRRTTLMGVILLLPVTLNVFLINMALDLWDETQRISLVLLVLNCVLFLFEWKKIRDVISIVVGKVKLRFNGWELAINLLLLIGLNFVFIKQLTTYRKTENELTGDWFNNKPNEWILKAEKLNDSTLVARDIKVHFDAGGRYAEITGSNMSNITNSVFDNSRSSYTIDEKQKIINFFDGNNTPLNVCTYTLTGNTLQITRVINKSPNRYFTQVFEKRVVNENKSN